MQKVILHSLLFDRSLGDGRVEGSWQDGGDGHGFGLQTFQMFDHVLLHFLNVLLQQHQVVPDVLGPGPGRPVPGNRTINSRQDRVELTPLDHSEDKLE